MINGEIVNHFLQMSNSASKRTIRSHTPLIKCGELDKRRRFNSISDLSEDPEHVDESEEICAVMIVMLPIGVVYDM